MQKLIVAHHLEAIVNGIENVLHDEWEIHTCMDSYPVIDMLKYLNPEAMVIDLNLHPKDGLTLLSDARPYLPPVILAMTNYVSPYILQTAEKLGVGRVLLIPCSMKYIKEQLDELNNSSVGGNYGYRL